MRAVPASSLGPERLVEVWNCAYAGYFVPMSWDVAQLRRHVAGGSIDLERSLVWMDGSEPIALSLLGVRGPTPWAESGHSTGSGGDHTTSSAQDPPLTLGDRGWIGGFGIAPSHRGRGLAASLMREQLDVARESGVRRVQLEVLTQNWAARSYERAGFVTTRRLAVLQGVLDPSAADPGRLPPITWLLPSVVPDLAGQLGRLHAAYAAAWSREAAGILTDARALRCLLAGPADAPDALALVRDDGGDRLQVVDAAASDATAARALVARLARDYAGRECRVVNEPEGSPLLDALARTGLAEVMAQYEMHWHA